MAVSLRLEKDVNPKIFEAEVRCCLSTTPNQKGGWQDFYHVNETLESQWHAKPPLLAVALPHSGQKRHFPPFPAHCQKSLHQKSLLFQLL